MHQSNSFFLVKQFSGVRLGSFCCRCIVFCLDVSEYSHKESWAHGHKSGHHQNFPLFPVQVEEALHGELAGICACHGARLARGKDTNRPHIEAVGAVQTAQPDAAGVEVSRHLLLGHTLQHRAVEMFRVESTLTAGLFRLDYNISKGKFHLLVYSIHKFVTYVD